MKISGRVLYLANSTALLRAQLDGEALETVPEDLVYGVNTDAMISGRACTLGFTPEVLGPYLLENFQETVAKNDIADGKFEVIVGGDAYGTGSSREVAVVAHEGAGIRLIIARSFQRIFQENMVYAGMPFTTDFSVLDLIASGEPVPETLFVEALPPFFREVARRGGLLAYGTALLAGEVEPTYRTDLASRPLNVVEKIIAQHAWKGSDLPFGVSAVEPGMQVFCQAGFRGMHEYTAGMVMTIYEDEWGHAPVEAPELAAAFEDHFVLLADPHVPAHVRESRLGPATRLAKHLEEVCDRHAIRIHGPGRALQGGVCHRIVVEDYATPGSIVVLTDSHTPTAGVLNTFAFGVGSTAMAFALRTGLIPVTVPHVVRVVVHGKPGEVTPKDLILHLIGDPYFREEEWRTSPTDTCVMQIGGPGLDHWNVDELSVLTNMSVEGGLMTGIIEPCQPITDFLKEQRGLDATDMLVHADEGASYIREIHINLEDVPVTVATPGDSRNRAELKAVGDIPIHNVVIASCTGGSYSDLAAAAAVLNGHELASGVRLTVTPSSTQVMEDAERDGILEVFRTIGGVVTAPGCGSCIGNGPGVPEPGETTASTTNRNFSRRMGAPGPVYLVSPAVAAASALSGRLVAPGPSD